jgi:hypothetical protein
MTNSIGPQRVDDSVPEPPLEDYEAAAASVRVEDDATTQDEDAAAKGQPNNREARYRIRAKEAEAERDRLTEQLTAMRRTQIEAHSTNMGIKPAALWASGTQIDSLLDDNGVPDLEKITAAVATARDTLGIEKATRLNLGTRSGSGASGPAQPKRDGWIDAFAPKPD